MATDVAPPDPKPEVRLVFDPSPPDIGGAERRLLEQYSGIPSDQIISHVLDVVRISPKFHGL